ncbi:MAG: VanZ family protein [Rothia sp. (in: high G+C Gram-positive bacteria)]|uniref:VanZ family protein n=1 Tax=Rothia sp. (in: high G+C Gram-positive bacteria) TaxID=1885016 RepID=UPI0026E010F9|nr:VanZ family protein [Rothia sp. (in: high G+C Gram-positive bacteria)]MDO5749634.1 VanZ family protein [Rothia sp. (in: high G+C Gram-positive bacteria)]
MKDLLNRHMAYVFGTEITVLTLILCAVGFTAMVYRGRRLNHRVGFKHYLLSGAFALFLASILAFTLTPIDVQSDYCTSGLYYPRFGLGWSWQEAWEQSSSAGFPQVFLTRNFAQLFFNIALFIPLGFFTAGCLKWDLLKTAIAGFTLSAFIELSQLTGNWGIAGCAYRTFDVDDLLNNTLGAVVGALVVYALRSLWKALFSRSADLHSA